VGTHLATGQSEEPLPEPIAVDGLGSRFATHARHVYEIAIVNDAPVSTVLTIGRG